MLVLTLRETPACRPTECSLRNTRATRSEVQPTRNGARRGRRHGDRESRNVPRGTEQQWFTWINSFCQAFISDSQPAQFSWKLGGAEHSARPRGCPSSPSAMLGSRSRAKILGSSGRGGQRLSPYLLISCRLSRFCLDASWRRSIRVFLREHSSDQSCPLG